MRWALLFSGQGTQHPTMLPWLDESAPLMQALLQHLGRADWRAALADEAWAQDNGHAQLLLTGTALAAWQQIAPRLPAPAAVAGYSVGELAAFSAAGVFAADVALQMAQQRAAAMTRCAERMPGALASVSGVPRAVLDSWLAEPAGAGLALAIDIDPQTAVVGGPVPALRALVARAESAGARAGLLRVGLASHTPAMRTASEAMAAVLDGQLLHPPGLPLWSNAEAAPVRDARQAAQVLARQIAQPVRWAELLQALRDRQPACVLEIGPGQALAAMWRRRFPEIPARSADEFRSARGLCEWLLRQLDG